ncbi:MAG: uroporphyrinogen decarboxylase family protein [Candidatus Bathyarchaeia archaeon]
MSRQAEMLLEERRERLERILTMGRPDRVAILPLFHYFPARYANFTYAEYSADYQKFYETLLKVFQDFDFDVMGFAIPGAGMALPLNFIFVKKYPDLATSIFNIAATFHNILKDRYTRWPGIELPPNNPAQFIGGKFMEAEEYDELAENPLDFIAKKIIPRAYDSLREFPSVEAYGALIRFGVELNKFTSIFISLIGRLRGLGYPSYPLGFGYAPLDFIADHLRHITYTLTDLYRCPDKVRRALDSLTPLIVEWSKLTVSLPSEVLAAFDIKIPIAFIPLHLNEMVPPRFFREFYWEPLKTVIVDLVNAGSVPWVFYEGDFTPFLDYILELPKGKTIAYFERADLRRARDVLGDHVILMGGLPPALLILGTPEKVYEETCRLLNDVKEPGGFIFAGSGVSGIPDETKPENLRAAIEAVKKCGIYA